ncbi:MAG: 50S ribosomal protein L6 [Deltaproteobacteria bacterium]|nr:50S ribosomal protein L6 [Deltaproteobacteria bacterium]
MSRVGRKPVEIPQGVQATLKENVLSVKGPKGTLSFTVPSLIKAAVEKDKIVVTRGAEDRFSKSQHGMVRNIVQNMVHGVTEQFVKELDIQGVGYRAELKGKNLQLALGFSHPVLFPIPEGIQIQVTNQTRLRIQGCDRHLVGQISAEIRGLKPPEPYQGKGIRYLNEVVKKKVGKAAAGAAGG